MKERKAKPTKADKKAAERLRALWDARRRDLGLTQQAIGDTMDIGQSAVSQYLHGLIPLGYAALLGFAEALQVDPREIRDDLPEQAGDLAPKHRADIEWTDILASEQAVSLGDGALPDDYAETHRLKFRLDSLRRKGLHAKNLVVYYGKGDSMDPRIKDGDAILFDTSDVRPKDGEIFVVQWRDHVYAKRVEIIDDVPYLRSDNPGGDHNWRKPKRLDSARDPVHVLGRVRWIGSWEGD